MPLSRPIVRRILKLCFALHGWAYDTASRFARQYYGMHPKHLFNSYHAFFLRHVRPTDVVVDIACGRGEVTVDVAERVHSVVAFDAEAASIAEARRLRSRPNIEYYVGEATRGLPAGRVFDVAISSNILEHLPNPDEHLRAVARIARLLLLRVPNLNRSWTVHVRRDLGMWYFSDPTHHREYTEESARAALEGAGWAVESVETSDELWVVARSRVAPRADAAAPHAAVRADR